MWKKILPVLCGFMTLINAVRLGSLLSQPEPLALAGQGQGFRLGQQGAQAYGVDEGHEPAQDGQDLFPHRGSLLTAPD